MPHRGLEERDHGQFPAWRPANYLQTIRQGMNLCRFLDPRHLPFERQQTLRWSGGGGTNRSERDRRGMLPAVERAGA